MALSYKNDEKQDERLDPYSDSARDLYHQEQSAYDREFEDITKNYDATADDGQENANVAGQKTTKNKNIDDTKEKETEAGDWKNKVGSGEKQKFSMKTFLKNKGPMGLILTLLFGGGFGLSVLFSPGIAIVNLKEIMLNDLNDQLGATSLRSDALLRGKLKDLQVGGSICTNTVSLRCKFATMSKRQVAKFQKAGFTIEPAEADKRFGRTKPTAIIFPPAADGTPGLRVTDPAQLKAHLRGNVTARSEIRKAFNPKFSTFADAVSAKVFARWKTDKSQKVTGATQEEMEESVTKATAGQAVGVNAEGHLTDEEGRNYVYDPTGNRIYESGDGSDLDKFKEIAENNKSVLSGIADEAQTSKPGSTAVSGLKSGLKGVSVLGPADTACSVYNFGRAVAAAAKVTRALQLVQYAMMIFNVGDRTKAGDVTQPETEFVGNTIMATDTNKTIVDEESVWEGSDPENAEAKARPNPDFGKTGLDARGYHIPAYNEAPTLSSRDLQYTVGGGLSGKLSSIMDTVASTLGGREKIRTTCGIVQSWWARTAGLIAGVVSAVGSFGASTVVTIGASVLIGFSLPFLKAALADISAGNVVSGKTKGMDSVNATFGGAGALFGSMAMGHGMTPSGKKDLKTYLAINNEVKADYIAMETYEAKNTPLDVYNQYSFLGSAVRKVNPAMIKSTASVSGALTNVPSLLSTAFTGLVPHVSAYEKFNDERFSKCHDEAYRELQIDADVFCNVRYYISPEQLAMDPDEALLWMLDNDHIEENGEPKSDEYKDWVKYCTEREDGWGETSNDDPGGNADKETGKICVEKNEQNKYFGVMFMDKSLNDAMDDDMSGTGETGFAEPATNDTTVITHPIPVTHTYLSDTPEQENIAAAKITKPAPAQLTSIQSVPNKLAEIDIRIHPGITYTIS